MNMNCKSTTVYGERIEDLLPALFTIQDAMTIDADGMYHASFALNAKDGAPLQRALMRVEAELLIEDADSIGSRHFEDRTHGQRAADALVRLLQTIGALPIKLKHPSSTPRSGFMPESGSYVGSRVDHYCLARSVFGP